MDSHVEDVLVPVDSRGFCIGKVYFFLKNDVDIQGFVQKHPIVNGRKFNLQKADNKVIKDYIYRKYFVKIGTQIAAKTEFNVDVKNENKPMQLSAQA